MIDSYTEKFNIDIKANVCMYALEILVG